MARKGLALTPRRLGFALSTLNKDTLIDLIAERARLAVGIGATEAEIAAVVQRWLDPVLVIREDRPVNLDRAMKRVDKNDEEYRNNPQGFNQSPTPTSTIWPEKMEEALKEQRNKPYRWT